MAVSLNNATGVVVQPTVAPVSQLPGCVVTPNGQVNVRSGPSTSYPVIGSLAAGDARQATGTNAARTWFVISYNGTVGYVAASVAAVSPDCAGVPVVADPPLPVNPVQPTAVVPTSAAPPTAVPTTAPGEPTLAPTTEQPTTAAPTTVPPTTAPVAPADNDYTVALDRNNGGQFAQVISNPGDTTDSVVASVSNFDSITTFAQFAVTLVCVGDGAGNVSWGLNQGGNLACGGSTTITMTNDSNNQRITVTLNGPGYVNYTFIFTKVS